MIKTKTLILGAGPAGLALANRLLQLGEEVLILEKETEAGGLCRSCDVDGAPFDIGGGHFLDVKNKTVNQFLFGFLPEEEWNLYERDSRIQLADREICHPIEANIWQLDIDAQVEYLISIAAAGCNQGKPEPEAFVDWIYWKLGEKIAENYMLSYNQKMFGQDLNQLGTYWLEKLPDVSFEETLRSCLEKKAYGTQPGHASFYYPKKYGYGELWSRMAKELGNRVKYSSVVETLDAPGKKVTLDNGDCYQADRIITTIPWNSIKEFPGMPDSLKRDVKRLKHSAVETRYFSSNLDTKAQWIYYPAQELPYHRILVRHNFCEGSMGYWTETNQERLYMFPKAVQEQFSYLNEYAYPLNAADKPEIMERLAEWSRAHMLFPLGRWGEHMHYNSDVTVEKALQLAERLAGGKRNVI